MDTCAGYRISGHLNSVAWPFLKCGKFLFMFMSLNIASLPLSSLLLLFGNQIKHGYSFLLCPQPPAIILFSFPCFCLSMCCPLCDFFWCTLHLMSSLFNTDRSAIKPTYWIFFVIQFFFSFLFLEILFRSFLNLPCHFCSPLFPRVILKFVFQFSNIVSFVILLAFWLVQYLKFEVSAKLLPIVFCCRFFFIVCFLCPSIFGWVLIILLKSVHRNNLVL